MESCWMGDRERERTDEGGGEEKDEWVGNKEVEKEAGKMTEHRWRRSAGTNLTRRLFLLPLEGRTGTTCGNNHPPNAS